MLIKFFINFNDFKLMGLKENKLKHIQNTKLKKKEIYRTIQTRLTLKEENPINSLFGLITL